MKYSNEQKIKLVGEYHDGKSVLEICLKNNIPRSTFYTWVKSYKTISSSADYNLNLVEFIRMKKRIDKQTQIFEILKKVNCTYSAPLQQKLSELEILHGQYSVRSLCEAMDFSSGTYYNHVFCNKKKNNSYQVRRDELSQQIKEIFEESHQIFGEKEIKAVLAERGVRTSDKTVSELMQQMNLVSIRTDAKKMYLLRNENKKKKYLLCKKFSAHAPSLVWVSDITMYHLLDKTYYICAILDLYSRKVISNKISERQSTQLLISTFKLAYSERKPADKLTFHCDQGTQYTSNKFRKLLGGLDVKQSFSPKSKPQYNAVMETFFATMKKEELYRTNYHSIKEFKDRIRNYMQFYNVTRPHTTLYYKTPEAYERMYYESFGRKKS